MARFALVPPSTRVFLVTFIAFLFTSTAQAQITNVTDDTSTPIPGVGHDYIHLLSETINPANGSLSIRIQVPTPKGRGITIPFSFGYNSNSVSHLVPAGQPGTAEWWSNTGYLSQGGWQYSAPMASFSSSVYTINPGGQTATQCYTFSNFMFTDPSGGHHALNLGSELSVGPSYCTGSGSYVNPGGDAVVNAFLTFDYGGTYNGNAPWYQPLNVYTADGTVYQFPLVGQVPGSNLPSSIEDRNGNIVVVTDSGNANFTFTDTAGRVAVSSNGMGPSGSTNTLSFSGLNYKVTWETVTSSFTVPSTQINPIAGVDCSPPPARNGSVTAVSQIELPNGEYYHLSYASPYGLLSEIDYPSGAWVKYTWKLSDTTNEFTNYPGETSSGQSTAMTMDS